MTSPSGAGRRSIDLAAFPEIPTPSQPAPCDTETQLFATTFPSHGELSQATAVLEAASAQYERIEPSAALARVAVPALVMNRDVRADLEAAASEILFSGWVPYRRPRVAMPDGPGPSEPGACFRRAAILVVRPCVADDASIRLVAHLDGDLGPVLPYLNAVISHASYTPSAQSLTYMSGHRMIALYRGRITIAKADEIVDGWLTLERIRRLVERTWARREQLEPSFEIRKRPPALEIFKRLPGTNCRLCGERTCMAFALRLWRGETSLQSCLPLAAEAGSHRSEALADILAGMGLAGADLP